MAYPEHYLAPHLSVERQIVDKLIDTILATETHTISVFDGLTWALAGSRDKDKITAEIAATDVTTLRVRDISGDKKPGQKVGSIFLIHGNDVDVISDWSDNDNTNAIVEETMKHCG
jgi:hypothetical protein